MAGTVPSGLVFSTLLLWSVLANMTWRYPLAMLLTYGCFFLLLHLYLVYLAHPFVQPASVSKGRDGGRVGVLSFGSGPGSPSGIGWPSAFGGGSSGGGGASGY